MNTCETCQFWVRNIAQGGAPGQDATESQQGDDENQGVECELFHGV